MVAERLLDARTVAEMCAGAEVGSQQRAAADEWLGMMDGGLLGDGEDDHANFARIVLGDLLGYGGGGIRREGGLADLEYAKGGKAVACIAAGCASAEGLFAPQCGGGGGRVSPARQAWGRMAATNAEYGICTNHRDFVLITKRFALAKCHAFDFRAVRSDPAALREFLGVFSARSLAGGFPYAAQARSAAADRGLAAEFYGLYSRTRLMLVREFQDKGLGKGDAAAAAQTCLNRLVFVFFAEGAGLVRRGMFGDGIAALLGGGIGADTRRVWNFIAGELFPAYAGGQEDPHIPAFAGGLFKGPLPASASFPDKRKKEFFGDTGGEPGRRSAGAWEYSPRIARAVSGAPGLNPVIENLLRLSSYDFRRQMRIDMMGRLFESSVTDLDVLLGGRAATRRREGIFYTPEYVTRYICARTIAGHLSPSGAARDPAELADECGGDLDGLRERMGRMKILDPACGSGAFLVGAARTLFDIHGEIARRERGGGGNGGGPGRHAGAGRISEAVRNSVYGIDTDPQSADIARLSLLLLTAAAGERLPDLSGNVVVGNSVVADPRQGGIDWKKAFPAVFAGENPGFSVIIGNPPYVRQEILADSAKHAMAALPDTVPLALPDGFCIPRTSDLSSYFYYHSLGRLRRGGRLGFISGDNWLRTEYGGPLRRALLSNSQIVELVSPRFKVFSDADVNTVVVLLVRSPPDPRSRVLFANAASDSDFAAPSLDVAARVLQSDLGGRNWSLYFDGPMLEPAFPVVRLKEAGRLKRGIGTGCNDFFVLSRDAARENGVPPCYLRPVVAGGELPRLEARRATRYVLCVESGKDELAKTEQGRLVKKYIERGERMTVLPKKGGGSAGVPLPELPTVASRSPWYSLPVPAPPPIFISRINDRSIRVYENEGRGRSAYRALDTYLHFTPSTESHTGAFLAYFASSHFALDMEKNAAPLGGGGLRIDNRVLMDARVPAFGRLPPRAVRGMEMAWSEYCRTLDRKKLDKAVFAALGMADQLDAVRAELDRLVDRRMRASKQAMGGDS